MQKLYILCCLCFFLVLNACQPSSKADREKWEAEIRAAEKAFNDLAQKEGLAKAFETFAAKDAVIKRKGELIKGNKTIGDWYRKDSKPNETLSWAPDFIEVSASGDLAYTYGSFVFTSLDSAGTPTESTGTFHTVWKRQEDGSWKFVWD